LAILKDIQVLSHILYVSYVLFFSQGVRVFLQVDVKKFKMIKKKAVFKI